MDSLSEEEIGRYTRCYQTLVAESEDSDGGLNMTDFEKLLGMCGHKLPKSVTDSLFVDTEADVRISLDDFLNCMSQIAPSGSSQSIAAAIRCKFDEQDLNKDGYISVDELRTVLGELNMALDDCWLKSFIKDWDTDGDGRINFEEFVNMYVKTEILDSDSEADEAEKKPNEEAVSQLNEMIIMADRIRRTCKDNDLVEDGMISSDNLRAVLADAEVNLVDEQLDSMFSLLDPDGEGRLPLEEFVSMFEDIAGDTCGGTDEGGHTEGGEVQMNGDGNPRYDKEYPEQEQAQEEAEERRAEMRDISEQSGEKEAPMFNKKKHKTEDIAKLGATFEGREKTRDHHVCHDDGAQAECKAVGVKALIARIESRKK